MTEQETTTDERILNKETLQRWIKEYFNKEENLESFFRSNSNRGLELISSEKDRGYLFCGEQQLDRDHERRMLEEKLIYRKGLGRNIIRCFIDNSEGISGFYWES